MVKTLWYRSRYQLAELIHSWGRHRWWLLAQALLLIVLVLLNMADGTLKPIEQWDWVDIWGEGATALLVLCWLLIILSVRPPGRVTSLFAAGLICVVLAFTQDWLDEFFKLADDVRWASWLESVPLGLGLLTAAFWLWRDEQKLIAHYLERRELLYSKPQAVEGGVYLPGLPYLQTQLRERAACEARWRSTALMMVELEQFNLFIHQFGGREADRLLMAVTELLLLSVRPQDLLCRYAGHRFVVLLSDLDEAGAKQIEQKLAELLAHYTFYTVAGRGGRPNCCTALAMAQPGGHPQEAAEALINEVAARLERGRAQGRGDA